MKVKGIQLSWIVVSNIEESIKFYTDVVGLKLSKFNKEYGWAELTGPEGSRLGISQANPAFGLKAGMNAVPTITVTDIKKAREAFLKNKVKLVGDVMEVPGQVKLQTFHDKDGNTFQLCELLK